MENISAKVVMLGPASAGKTSIVKSWLIQNVNDMEANLPTTLSTNIYDLNVKTKSGKIVTMTIWDTAGQERFRTLTPIYCRGVDIACLVYDTTNNGSFVEMQSWNSELRRFHHYSKFSTIILANKIDLEVEHSYDVEDDYNDAKALEYAQSMGAKLFKTSAKTQANLDRALKTIAEEIVKRRERKEENLQETTSFQLDQHDQTHRRRRKCC